MRLESKNSVEMFNNSSVHRCSSAVWHLLKFHAHVHTHGTGWHKTRHRRSGRMPVKRSDRSKPGLWWEPFSDVKRKWMVWGSVLTTLILTFLDSQFLNPIQINVSYSLWTSICLSITWWHGRVDDVTTSAVTERWSHQSWWIDGGGWERGQEEAQCGQHQHAAWVDCSLREEVVVKVDREEEERGGVKMKRKKMKPHTPHRGHPDHISSHPSIPPSFNCWKIKKSSQ